MNLAAAAIIYLEPFALEVYRQPFWLGLLGGRTPKRLIAWSNDTLISGLNLGKMCREKKNALTGEKTTRYLAPYLYVS